MKRQLESFDELAVTPRTVTERLKPAHARFGWLQTPALL
jgi:hypothetical protein